MWVERAEEGGPVSTILLVIVIEKGKVMGECMRATLVRTAEIFAIRAHSHLVEDMGDV